MMLLAFLAAAFAAAPSGVVVAAPADNSGLNLTVTWLPVADAVGYSVLRADSEAGPWSVVADQIPPTDTGISDQVSTDPRNDPPKDRYLYKVVALDASSPVPPALETDAAKAEAGRTAYVAALASSPNASTAVEGRPEASLFITTPGHGLLLAMIASVGASRCDKGNRSSSAASRASTRSRRGSGAPRRWAARCSTSPASTSSRTSRRLPRC
jgi:hypothetical protein